MTQVGEGHETAADADGPVMTFGAPTVGEVLAERYQLEEHVNNDSAGRQVWRGIDVILRRPVAVVLRHPGGEPATEMLQAAVDASRVIHPNLVGVYDAIDEGERAYVVREWVDGESLRELVGEEGPLDPARATAIARAIADALAAVHATGMVHGNVHPGTTLIARRRPGGARRRAGRLGRQRRDRHPRGRRHPLLRADRATGRTPRSAGRRCPTPTATARGNPAAPRQIRAGVPAYLDDLTMDLLDKRVQAPEADALAGELARLDSADDEYEDVGPLRFAQNALDRADAQHQQDHRRGRGAGRDRDRRPGLRHPGDHQLRLARPAQRTHAGTGRTTFRAPRRPTPQPAAPTPTKIPLTASMVRIVDPPDGDRSDTGEAAYTVDSDPDTAWETQRFKQPNFGNLKPGMGVLINLGTPRTLAEVRVETSAPGVAMDIRTGPNDPGDTSSGDAEDRQDVQEARRRRQLPRPTAPTESSRSSTPTEVPVRPGVPHRAAAGGRRQGRLQDQRQQGRGLRLLIEDGVGPAGPTPFLDQLGWQGDFGDGLIGAELELPSDADLLRAHVDGDPQAFAELVRRHRDRLWAVALRTSATARRPPTPCRTRCSRRIATRPASAATRPSPPGCTASW